MNAINLEIHFLTLELIENSFTGRWLIYNPTCTVASGWKTMEIRVNKGKDQHLKTVGIQKSPPPAKPAVSWVLACCPVRGKNTFSKLTYVDFHMYPSLLFFHFFIIFFSCLLLSSCPSLLVSAQNKHIHNLTWEVFFFGFSNLVRKDQDDDPGVKHFKKHVGVAILIVLIGSF